MFTAMGGRKIYLAVSTDLVIDQRVHRTAMTLTEAGAASVLVGRLLPGSREMDARPYDVKRLRLVFRKGFMFYACFNFRLAWFLMFRKIRMLVANDLDTLPACYLVSRLKGVSLVYDSHEYFTEVPELSGRRFVRSIWRGIERCLLPSVKHSYTVCRSIADAYNGKYGMSMKVVRNLPPARKEETRSRDLPDSGHVIIYQGTLNAGRGLDLMIRAMQYLEGFRFRIFGDGPVFSELVRLRDRLDVGGRVEFMGRIPFGVLGEHTRRASLGISLEENAGLNYYYALPNKLFDYIQAQIPVLVSDLPEMRSIVEQYGIGEVLAGREPEMLAEQVRRMMHDREQRVQWKKNLEDAAGELCWEKEEGKLKDVYRGAGLILT